MLTVEEAIETATTYAKTHLGEFDGVLVEEIDLSDKEYVLITLGWERPKWMKRVYKVFYVSKEGCCVDKVKIREVENYR